MAASIYDEASLDEIIAKEPMEQPYLRPLLDAPHVFSQQWRQTSTVDPPRIEDGILRTRLAKVLIAHHREMRLNPYNPKMWFDRGRHVIELGYGDLAVSDAYKARLLLDSFLGVFDTNVAYSELDKDGLPCKVSAALAGTVKRPDTGAARGYDAALCPEEFGRGNKAVKRVKSKFETASTNATLGLSSIGGTTSDNLGVFARQDISRHDLIMIVACVGTLKVNYNDDNPRYSIFKLHDNVIAPVRILQTLGVDVFKDMRFNSWALQTLTHRIENNMNYTKKGEVTYSAICPLFCMFNHDCDPSVDWNAYYQTKYQGGPVFVVATWNIKAGEEISVSYIVDIPLEIDRRPRLVAQIGCMCGCARCYKERKDTLERERKDHLEKEELLKFAERLSDLEYSQVMNGISKDDHDEIYRRLRVLRARNSSL